MKRLLCLLALTLVFPAVAAAEPVEETNCITHPALCEDEPEEPAEAPWCHTEAECEADPGVELTPYQEEWIAYVEWLEGHDKAAAEALIEREGGTDVQATATPSAVVGVVHHARASHACRKATSPAPAPLKLEG